jgi:phosphatidylserine/phosphatidylglycerophosphate/cardiolipin synthase-like enzyme
MNGLQTNLRLRLVTSVEETQAYTAPDSERVSCKPEARRKAVIEFIRSAESSLLLSMFRCDDLAVLHELGEAVARGVKVEVLVTGRAKGWGKRLNPLAGCLNCMGVTVHRFKSSSKYHAKYMVADGRSALIATQNLTRKCFRRTRDFVLVTRDAAIAAGLKATFRADLDGKPAPSTERLILGPEGSRERIEQLLGSAKKSIRILDHKLSDPGVLAILRDRARKGIEVAVEKGNEMTGKTPHGRLIIVDGAIAVFGSFALTSQSLDTRRELAVIIEQPALVAKLERQFEKASKKIAAVRVVAA